MSKLPERFVFRSFSPTFCLKQDYLRLLDWTTMALPTPGSPISREMPQPLGGTASTVGLCVLVETLSAVGLVSQRFVHFMVPLLEAEFLVTFPHKHNPTELTGSSQETPCKFISTASCNFPTLVHVTLETGRYF